MHLKLVTLALTLTIGQADAGEKPARPPHLVVILADDLGYGDPRCYNKDSKIPTPHIDRVAKQGMRFRDAHAAAAVCTPSRYGLLTGRYPWRSSLKKGVLVGDSPALLEPGRLTLAALLRRCGYRTAGVGKWHLGLGSAGKTDFAKPLRPGPNAAGFDYFFGIPASLDMPPYVYVENERVTEAPTGTIADNESPKGGAAFWRGGPIAPGFKHAAVNDRLTEKAVELIRDRPKEKPLFLYVALAAPHMPVLPTRPFVGKSGAGPYGDFVAQVDDSVGRVMMALDDAKMADDTLLIVTSDNGGFWYPQDIAKWNHRANGPLRGQKADIWEGGHRVPFLARWPGRIAADSTSDEVICLTDLMATAATLTGTPLPDDAAEDSFDLTPVLLGKKRDGAIRPATIHQSADGTLAIRQGPWRLTPALGSHGFSEPRNVAAKPGGPQGELVHLERDLAEQANVWQEEPEVVRRLTALLEKLKNDGRSRPVRAAPR